MPTEELFGAYHSAKADCDTFEFDTILPPMDDPLQAEYLAPGVYVQEYPGEPANEGSREPSYLTIKIEPERVRDWDTEHVDYVL